MISFELISSDLGEESYRRYFEQLRDLTGLHESIADETRDSTIDYLRDLAPIRHKTATNLGATPTGALSDAAERVTSQSDESSATVVVVGDLFARAFRDITITPKNARALTIPINAVAYGRRVAELEAEGYIFFKPKDQDKPILWATNPSGESMPMYVLAASVEQPQDRTLLPSDEEFLISARNGALNYFDRMLTEI